MRILFFYPRWGSNNIPWDVFLHKIKQAGYDGVEIGLPVGEAEKYTVFNLLEKLGLKYIIQHYETFSPNFANHLAEFTQRLDIISSYHPCLVNSHTGRDFFSFEQNSLLLQEAKSIADKHEITIAHETHRGRFSFAAHITRGFIQYDWLKLTLDISHWFCVAETLLNDQQKTLDDIIPHVQHIHARIGSTQAAQIYNPCDEQWTETIERHLNIWDKVIFFHKNINAEAIGITTEFGPWPYMQQTPSGKSGLDYQHELNTRMLQQLKERYKHI